MALTPQRCSWFQRFMGAGCEKLLAFVGTIALAFGDVLLQPTRGHYPRLLHESIAFGLIGYHRGEIKVLDRPGLIGAACESYTQDRALYAKMLVPSPAHT